MRPAISVCALQLQQVQAERQRLSMERQTVEREIGELNQHMPNERGSEEEERREELNSIQLPALLERARSAGMRESALVAELSRDGARLAEIQKQLQRLAGTAAAP